MASGAQFGFPELAKLLIPVSVSRVSSVALHPELISDDPRCESALAEDLADFRRFLELTREHGELITGSQASLLLGVPTSQIGSWRARGRFSAWQLMGLWMMPAAEILALRAERARGVFPSPGRKAPSLAALVRAGASDAMRC